MPDEAALLARLLCGDEAAFTELFRLHNPSIVRLAHAITGSRASAEEISQETWLAVINGIDGFENRASLRNWIFRIASNKARSRSRRDGRTVSLGQESDNSAALSDDMFQKNGSWKHPIALWDDITPERILAGRQAWKQVSLIIDTLPPVQQAILTLLQGEKLSAGEIATLLGTTPGNVRVHLHRAREAIRRRLDRQLAQQNKNSRNM